MGLGSGEEIKPWVCRARRDVSLVPFLWRKLEGHLPDHGNVDAVFVHKFQFLYTICISEGRARMVGMNHAVVPSRSQYCGPTGLPPLGSWSRISSLSCCVEVSVRMKGTAVRDRSTEA